MTPTHARRGRRSALALVALAAAAAGLALSSVLPPRPGTGDDPTPPAGEPDSFELDEPRRGLRLIGIVVALAVAGGLAYGAYAMWFAGDAGEERGLLTEPVGRTTIRASVVASGSVEPVDQVELRFSRSGRVVEALVAVGDEVAQGDPLMHLDGDALENRLASAQASLALSQANLRRLLQEASPADVSAAEQSVVAAETAVARAERDLEDLLDGATAAEVAVAEEAVVAAEAALDRAERDLQRLLDPPSAAERAAAEQAVVTALAARDRAQRDLDDLRDGPTAQEIAAAEQAVAGAEATLVSAQATYADLMAGPSAAQIASAESAVVAAEQAIAGAEIALENATSNVDAAEAGLTGAGSTYCALQSPDPLCSPFLIPLSSGDVSYLLGILGDETTSAAVLTAANAVIQANVGYLAALNSVETAEASLLSAQASLDAAEAALAALLAGPDQSDIDAAVAAIDAAQASLDSATSRLDDLMDGPAPGAIATAEEALASAEAALATAQANLADLLHGAEADQIAAAENAVLSATAALNTANARYDDLLAGADASAVATAQDAIRAQQATLDAAIARRDDLLAGADPEDVNAHRQQVRQAELAVQAARLDLDETTLTAPFDGTVAAVNAQPGDLATAGAGALTLLTPGMMKVELSVGETELPQIRVGMGGGIIFDAIPGKPFIISVYAIDLAPNVQQGVVTYMVEASILGLDGDGPKPAPGMNGTVALITDQRPDVLAVQSRAIHRLGDDLVVDVLVGGVAESRVIETGLNDGEMTEVVSGLEEGELVVVGFGAPGEEGGEDGAPTPIDLPEGIR